MLPQGCRRRCSRASCSADRRCRPSCDEVFLPHNGQKVFADPGAALRVKDVEVLEDVVGKHVRLNCELPIGDVSGYAKRFRNVFNAEDGKLQLVEFQIAHLLQYYGKFAAESAEGFEQL